jgi:hypothetical protein
MEEVVYGPLQRNGSSSIVACLFVTARMCLATCCLAMDHIPSQELFIPLWHPRMTEWEILTLHIMMNTHIYSNNLALKQTKCINLYYLKGDMSYDNVVSAVQFIQHRTRCKYNSGQWIQKAIMTVSPWNENIKLPRISLGMLIYPTVLHKSDASPFK